MDFMPVQYSKLGLTIALYRGTIKLFSLYNGHPCRTLFLTFLATFPILIPLNFRIRTVYFVRSEVAAVINYVLN